MFWQEIKKQVKYMDIIIIILLVFASFIPYSVATIIQGDVEETPERVAIVTIDGKEVDRYILKKGAEHQLKTYYPKEGQYNIVEVSGEKIRVKEDNSPDQVAVNTSWISKPGQFSLCIPHRLLIEIKNSQPSDEDDLIISY